MFCLILTLYCTILLYSSTILFFCFATILLLYYSSMCLILVLCDVVRISGVSQINFDPLIKIYEVWIYMSKFSSRFFNQETEQAFGRTRCVTSFWSPFQGDGPSENASCRQQLDRRCQHMSTRCVFTRTLLDLNSAVLFDPLLCAGDDGVFFLTACR